MSCNFKTLTETGRLDPTHSNIQVTPVWGGPGYDLGKPDCRTGGYGTLTTAYNNNGNGCNNGNFVTGLCGGNTNMRSRVNRM